MLLDGREELVLPFNSHHHNNNHNDDDAANADGMALEQVLREVGGSSGSSKPTSSSTAVETSSGSGGSGGPEAERRAWSRLLSEGGLRVGAVLDVSEEVGPGFVSFLAGPRLALPALLQERTRDLLILARGTAGMAAVASALDWHKVGAHAKSGGSGAGSGAGGEAHGSGHGHGLGHGSHPHPHPHHQTPQQRPRITVLLEQDSALAAAATSAARHDPLRGAWARWQAALGSSVRVIPVLRPPRAARRASSDGVSGGVEAALFKGEAGGFSPVLGIDPNACAVLVAGMGQRRRARLATSLLRAGVHPARILDHSLDLARGPGVAPPVERCEQLPPALAAPCCASCGGGGSAGAAGSAPSSAR